jgi:hypothetical protein
MGSRILEGESYLFRSRITSTGRGILNFGDSKVMFLLKRPRAGEERETKKPDESTDGDFKYSKTERTP